MTDRRWHGIWKEQCEAGEAIMLCLGVERAFDYVVGEKLLNFADAATRYPAFARTLPRFVSAVRRMFTPEEMRANLLRIERREPGEAASQERNGGLECAESATRRARQFDLVRELLTAPAAAPS